MTIDDIMNVRNQKPNQIPALKQYVLNTALPQYKGKEQHTEE